MIARLVLTNLFLVMLMGTLFAQSADTVYVPANMPNGDPYVNSLIDKVVADTNAAGQQLHTVYKLERGNFYLLDKAISLRNPVKLIADAPDASNTPPKILSNITASGGTSTGSLIITWADITVKNIWLSGIDLGGVNHGWGTCGALLVQDSLVTVTLDGVWADENGWCSFGTYQPHTRWHINNFHAINEIHSGDQWCIFLFYLEGATVVDTFIVKNSSHFQSGGPFIYPPGVISYIEVDHCTFVNTYKHPFHKTQWLTAKFTNNIFYNSGALSMTAKENESQDPDDLPFGLINVDTLTANQVGDTSLYSPYTIPENQRSIVVKNNLYYFSPEIQAYWAAHDTVGHQLWMNSRTIAMFANDAVWPGLVAENTWNQDPLFNDFPRISEANAKLAQACTDIRAGSTHGWDWDGDQLTDPTYYRLMIQYPTVENFRSYSGLLGTDGLPLGDLSFYPVTPIILTNGGFGSSDGWTKLFDLAGLVGDSATFDFNYATVPTGGVPPGLRMTGTAAGWGPNPNSAIYQAVSLEAATSYLLSGVIQAVPGSSNYWSEFWLVDVLPTAGKDITVANYPGAVNLAALKAAAWGGIDDYNGPLSGCPTPSVAFTVPNTGTYYLAVKSGCGGGSMDILLDNLTLTAIPTGVKNEPASVVKTFSLQQNYPNPFNPSTNFTYQIGKAGFVSVKIYDLLGREVATLVNEFKQAGSYPATWNAASFGSGVYFYKMQSGSFTSTKKMILMK